MISLLTHGLNWTQNLFLSGVAVIKCALLSKWPSPTPPVSSNELVILGNGPSLNLTLQEDIDYLESRDLMGVNLFACSEAFQKLKPSYYIWLDPAFAEEEHPAGQKARTALKEHTNWPLTLLVPMTFKKSPAFQFFSNHPYIQVHYFNYVICEGLPKFKWTLFRWGLGMPQCQNVLIAAIFQSIQLGFKKIWITGADHTWHEDIRLNEANELQVFDTHFYEKEKNITQMFTSMYAHRSYLSAAFLSLHKVYRGYEVLAAYAASRNVLIQNASKKSYIDVFPKKSLS